MQQESKPGFLNVEPEESSPIHLNRIPIGFYLLNLVVTYLTEFNRPPVSLLAREVSY